MQMCDLETSCKGFCGSGQVLSGVQRPGRKYCSCDAMCLVYKDCCEDFKDECPHEASFLGRVKSLVTSEVKCVPVNEDLSATVISSCSSQVTAHVDEYNGNDTGIDMIKMSDKELTSTVLVTDPVTSITFANEDVYLRCNYLVPTGIERMIKWRKEYRSKDVGVDVADLEQFLTNGTSSRGFLENIYDVPPRNIPIRMCSH